MLKVGVVKVEMAASARSSPLCKVWRQAETLLDLAAKVETRSQ